MKDRFPYILSLGGKMRLALVVCAVLIVASCGGSHQEPIIPIVQAAGPQCFAEQFITSGSRETSDSVWFATDQACDIGTLQDQNYTLQQSHTVQQIVIQQGSNTGSVFEWDVILTITRPDGRQLRIQQQYDKHEDSVGNRQVAYPLNMPLNLPAGTTLNLHRRDLPAGYCIKAGQWGSGQACATGQSVQLIGVLQ